MTRRGAEVGRHLPQGSSGTTRASARRVTGALRRCVADESGSISLEYLLMTMTVGLLAAIGLITTIGPSLVSMWSERRACLYDDACRSPSPAGVTPEPRAPSDETRGARAEP